MFKYFTFILMVAAISFASETEIIGSDDSQGYSRSTEPQNVNTASFHKGSHILNPGVGFGNSILGIEYEYGIVDFLGIEIGAGFIGMNVGPNFHVLRTKHVDLYFAPNFAFVPGLVYMPGLNFGSRFYFGQAAKVGISGMIGFGFIANSVTSGNVHYSPGQLEINVGLGVPIRIK